MSNIINPILPQTFEVVRDRIGEILAIELPNQFVLQGEAVLDAPVFVERWIPVNVNEKQIVNVRLADGDYDSKSISNSDGVYTYNIDVETIAKGSGDDFGDSTSLKNLHRLMGVCRQILETPVYQYLGFEGEPEAVILRSTIKKIQISDPTNQRDSSFRMMGRLPFEVRLNESGEPLLAKPLNEHITQATLNETDLGYKYVINT